MKNKFFEPYVDFQKQIGFMIRWIKSDFGTGRKAFTFKIMLPFVSIGLRFYYGKGRVNLLKVNNKF